MHPGLLSRYLSMSAYSPAAKSGSSHFVIDQPAAAAACATARRAIKQGRHKAAQTQLINALRLRPSCALAYKLLGDLFAGDDDGEAAKLCYRNLLPESVLNSCFPQSDILQINEGRYCRVEVVDSVATPVPVPGVVKGESPFSEQTIRSASGFVDTIPAGSLWHDDANTMVFDQCGGVLTEHTVGSSQMLQVLAAEYEPLRVGGRVILLGARGAHNFYHWTTDIIPKIGLLVKSGVKPEVSDRFIVSRGGAPFARQLLAVFGIQPSQIIETELSSPFISADELLVPYLRNKMGFTMGTWVPDYLKSAMSVHNSPPGSRKLFIDRNPDTGVGRTLVNATEVTTLFESNGFEIVYPELLTVEQQARLFASAAVVAGVHGAGFSNIVYCGKGTKVIEFYGAHIAPCYWIISALAGLEYFHHRCGDAPQATTVAGVSRHAAGFELPLSEAQAMLDLAGL